MENGIILRICGKNGSYVKLSHPDGRYYEGDYNRDTGNFIGVGKYLHSNGDIFHGEFKDSKKNGIGKFWIAKEKKWKYGVWVDNEIGLNPKTLESKEDPANSMTELSKEEFWQQVETKKLKGKYD